MGQCAALVADVESLVDLGRAWILGEAGATGLWSNHAARGPTPLPESAEHANTRSSPVPCRALDATRLWRRNPSATLETDMRPTASVLERTTAIRDITGSPDRNSPYNSC